MAVETRGKLEDVTYSITDLLDERITFPVLHAPSSHECSHCPQKTQKMHIVLKVLQFSF